MAVGGGMVVRGMVPGSVALGGQATVAEATGKGVDTMGGWGLGARAEDWGGGVGHASAEDLHLAQGQRDVSVIVGYRAGAQELHDDVAPNDGLVAGQVVPGKAGNGVEGAQRVGGGVHRSVHKAHAHGKVHEGQAGTAHSRTRCVGERA